MADATVAPGVTREDDSWWWTLKGDRDDLIATGLVQSEWFLNGTKRNKRGYAVRRHRLNVDGRIVSVVQPAKGLCEVRFHRTPDELRQYDEEHREEDKPTDIKSEVRAYADFALPQVLGVFNLAGDRDWEFPPDIKRRALTLFKELAHLFFENEDKITPTKSAIAKSDAQFQNFMQRVTG